MNVDAAPGEVLIIHNRSRLIAIQGQPEFPAAFRQWLGVIVSGFSSNRLANQVLGDRGRALFAIYCLYLHYVAGSNGARGLTVSRAQELCRVTGLCSRGRAATLIALLRFGGYLAPAASADLRRRVLVPTDRFLHEQRKRWRAHFTAMRPWCDVAGEICDLLSDETFTRLFLDRLGGRFIGGYRVLDAVPVLADLLESNGTFLMLCALLLEADEPPPRGGVEVRISTSALSSRFGVARAHVRAQLVKAAEAGLLRRADDAGCIVVLPALHEAVQDFAAASFLLFDQCGREALADLAAGV